MVDGSGQSRRAGNHDPGNARVPGRGLRAHGAPRLGVGCRSGKGGEPDGRDAVRRHRQTADYQKPRDRHKGEYIHQGFHNIVVLIFIFQET